MDYGLYLSAAGAKAQITRQAVITNNIANSQTAGFKRDLVIMQSRLNASYEDPAMFPYRLPVYGDQGGGVTAVSDGIDLSQSTFEDTHNRTDFALNGPGFFTIAGDNGETLLTRDGRFMIDSEGALRTVAGGNRPVLNNAGEPVRLNPDLPLEIAHDGTITQNGQGTGLKLGITDADPKTLVKLGGNLLRSATPLTPASAETEVLQYKLENSGVEPMVEIVNMMEGQRAFDANARMMTYQDSTMSLLNTVGRVA
jgi:flagellar basal-body rod protein FlgF